MIPADVALLILRIVLGTTYIAHGARKLGWIGGGHPSEFTASIARRGFRPAVAWATAAVISEVIGGALVVLGLLTPLGGALLVAQSVTIAVLVADRGFWHTDGGLEYPLVLAAAAGAVALAGPGALSLDAVLRLEPPSELGAIAVAAAVGGSLASLLTRRSTEASARADTTGSGGPPGQRPGS